jgi:hypothetical protein
MRGLALGNHYQPLATKSGENFNFQTHLASSSWHLAAWIIVIFAVFTTLSVREYRKV